MQSYRNKYLYILFISGLLLAGAHQLILLFNFNTSLTPSAYIIATTLSVLSFVIINYALIRLSLVRGKVKSVPYILFCISIVVASIISSVIGPIKSFSTFNSYTLPILELTYVTIILILLTQVKMVISTSYHYVALSMMLISTLAHLFHHYFIGEFTLWLHIITCVTYLLYFVFLFMVLFSLVTDKMIHTYFSSLQDHMTGLYLRQIFLKKLARLFETSPIAIIFCDIDNFKQLNDTKGHLEADKVLIEVANIIKHETADTGYAGRYGGEEIVAGIDISHVNAEAIAEHIRKRIAEETAVTVSIGISTSKDSKELYTLLQYADEAMYYSKTTGKNKVSTYKSLPAAYRNK